MVHLREAVCFCMFVKLCPASLDIDGQSEKPPICKVIQEKRNLLSAFCVFPFVFSFIY